jgi:tRNA (adenine22-N1)-methyltransferase
MGLSNRLKHFSTFFDGKPHIWDIGCDHGHLGLSFTQYSEVETIHLVDPALPVIEALSLKFKDSYISIGKDIEILHSKGQDLKIKVPNQNGLYIAGMGGREIKEILESLDSQLGEQDRIFVSPHRHVLELRAYLQHTNFRLIEEGVIFEARHYYPYLYLSKDPAHDEITPYGDALWKSDEGKRYLKYLVGHMSCHKDQASLEYLAFLRAQLS